MKSINPVSCLFLVFTALVISACSSGGYSPWVYSSSDRVAAEQPPKPLTRNLEAPEPDSYLEYPGLGAEYPGLSESGVLAEGEQYAMARPPEMVLQPKQPLQVAPVKVALLVPLSGKHDTLGQAMLQAAQLALFDVGQPGFELIPRDTEGTPEGARRAAEQAIAQGARLILGPVFSGEVEAVKPIASRANVNVIGFSTDWTLAGGNTFIMGFLPFDQIERLTKYLAYRNPGHIGILAPSSNYGRVVAGAFQRAADYYGMPPAQVTYFEPDSTNLAPIVREFTQYDARTTGADVAKITKVSTKTGLPYDAVLMPVGGETALSISNLLSHYGMPPRKVRRLGTGLFDEEGLATEQSLDGAWFAAPSPEMRKSFEQRYRDLYGAQPQRLSTLAYDATALAAVLAHRGIEQTGLPDFSRTALTNPNGYAGIDGIFRFRSNGTVERGLAVLGFADEQIVVIEDAPVTFQMPAPYQ